MTFYMLAGSLCLSASDSLCDVTVAVSDFSNFEGVKKAVLEASKSGAVVDLAGPCDAEDEIEEGVGDCSEDGQRVEEGCGV